MLILSIIGLLIIGSTINRIIARNPPDNIPDRTAAFAEVFDILYGMYPEANMGTSTVVLCLNDLNENDYDCAVNGIGAYCRANGIKLSYSSYGESPDNAALLDEENLIFTFERVRYPRSSRETSKLLSVCRSIIPEQPDLHSMYHVIGSRMLGTVTGRALRK